jgi:hypothetical protein
MKNAFMTCLQQATNYTVTENGALAHKSTCNALYDMFALGGAYRSRSDDDCILLFKNAYDTDPMYALKCLFYLGDCRGGQGERRFFRVCAKWLASYDPKAMLRNLKYISEYRRWDDLYLFVGTPLEAEVFQFMKAQLALDVQCKTPSLLAKWLKSENTSSKESRYLANKTREAFGMTHKQYRKTLSILRERINLLERLMSANRWDEIEFDKIPSKAGLVYRNAFARKDIIKAKYEAFAQNKTTKVNAKTLYPADIAHQAFQYRCSTTDRAMLDKYWEGLADYYNGKEENGLAVVDVSGSMHGLPMEAAVAMGAYIAERGHGPFANHFITFSESPNLVRFEGVDIYDKFNRARRANWGYNTNIEKVFDLMLRTAMQSKCAAADMPDTLYVFSDMEFDEGLSVPKNGIDTLLESIAKKWAVYGYKLPRVIFWNLAARNDNIPALNGRFGYVSGFSMSMVESVLSGKDGIALMFEKLDSARYACIQ